MAIKQIGVYNGTSWELDDIGADASNIILNNQLVESSNLQTVLNNILPINKLTASKWVGTDANGRLISKNPPVVTSVEYASVQGSASAPVVIGAKTAGVGQFLLQANQTNKTVSLFKRLDASGTQVNQTIFTIGGKPTSLDWDWHNTGLSYLNTSESMGASVSHIPQYLIQVSHLWLSLKPNFPLNQDIPMIKITLPEGKQIEGGFFSTPIVAYRENSTTYDIAVIQITSSGALSIRVETPDSSSVIKRTLSTGGITAILKDDN